MARSRRPSAQTMSIVSALAARPSEWRYGYVLCQELGLKAGTVYPILMRLAERGLVETRWEADAPPGRPPRHLYRLTGDGVALAVAEPAVPSESAEPAGLRLRPGWETP